MKVMTVLGTRPEIIRLSRIIEKLDRTCQHVLVHTGQNYDPNLNDVFFQQLDVRAPDHYLNAKGSLGEQLGILLAETEKILQKEKPDKLLILGDTNSALSAIIAKRYGIPVYHMEAGNRCYDDRVPEEVNRRIIDHSSDVLMPYTERSRQNLLREGIPGQCIFVTGNPIYEVIRHYDDQIQASTILRDLELAAAKYFLVTLHRAENVDLEERLRELTLALERIQQEHNLPVIVSTHPHTRARMESFGIINQNADVHFLQPFGFFDFIKLEQNAACVLSDSGTVQEECAIFKVANVTLRDVTERPETLECGSNVLTGANAESIIRCVGLVLGQKEGWYVPPEYLVENVSDTVLKILYGYLHTQV
ncbi:MAG: UDP-N-acetylglucosamine 2-epimerase (non-hydrolyzing) [Anaerolineales bacterium]|nr:UDP-N-acetylglucosamine 2-epimerase (non-hydrolyzing) [Anaerolineales bacterium]